MSAPANLEECYVHELKDLISANDQMRRTIKKIGKKAKNGELKAHIDTSVTKIEEHTSTLKELLKEMGEKGKEHCKGMEGLCTEAEKHCIEEAPEKSEVRDVVIVAQFQRMSHYGICGFGTAAAYAEAVGKAKHAKAIDKITKDIYGSDEAMTKLAEGCVNAAAA